MAALEMRRLAFRNPPASPPPSPSEASDYTTSTSYFQLSLPNKPESTPASIMNSLGQDDICPRCFQKKLLRAIDIINEFGRFSDEFDVFFAQRERCFAVFSSDHSDAESRPRLETDVSSGQPSHSQPEAGVSPEQSSDECYGSADQQESSSSDESSDDSDAESEPHPRSETDVSPGQPTDEGHGSAEQQKSSFDLSSDDTDSSYDTEISECPGCAECMQNNIPGFSGNTPNIPVGDVEPSESGVNDYPATYQVDGFDDASPSRGNSSGNPTDVPVTDSGTLRSGCNNRYCLCAHVRQSNLERQSFELPDRTRDNPDSDSDGVPLAESHTLPGVDSQGYPLSQHENESGQHGTNDSYHTGDDASSSGSPAKRKQSPVCYDMPSPKSNTLARARPRAMSEPRPFTQGSSFIVKGNYGIYGYEKTEDWSPAQSQAVDDADEGDEGGEGDECDEGDVDCFMIYQDLVDATMNGESVDADDELVISYLRASCGAVVRGYMDEAQPSGPADGDDAE